MSQVSGAQSARPAPFQMKAPTAEIGSARLHTSFAALALLCAVAVMLAVPSCGEDHGPTGGTQDTPTAEEGGADTAAPEPKCENASDCTGAAGPCMMWTCEAGSCAQQPDDNAEGAACDDGNGCTQNDQCVAGTCVGAGVSCDDGNICTDDFCSAGTCQHPPRAGSCDDGSACTEADTCQEGKCVGGTNVCGCVSDDDCLNLNGDNLCAAPHRCVNNFCVRDFDAAVDCTLLNGPCRSAECNPASGQCEETMVPNGTPCDDGLACSSGGVCSAGDCVGSGGAAPCDDGNPCTQDVCTPDEQCVYTPMPNGSPCKDEDPCTGGESCAAGVCKATSATVCNDNNPCTSDNCQPGGGCVFLPFDGPCDDGNACTAGENCGTGTCTGGTPVSCDDGEDCTIEVCSPASGCLFEPVTEGVLCNDGDPCTTGDRCVGGKCAPQGVLTCGDNNPCTTDACGPGESCSYAPLPDGTICDDGDACTTGDICQGGLCVATGPSCDPCVVGGDGTACDDGSALTVGDFCWAGVCQGFQRQVYGPTPTSTGSALRAIGQDKFGVWAVGWTREVADTIATFGTELRGTLLPGLASTSVRADTNYVAINHGVAIGDNGIASSFNGSAWDKNTGMNGALAAALPAPASVRTLVGAPLSTTPGSQRDVWYAAGVAAGGLPWLARCQRDSAPGGGFFWVCEPGTGFSSVLGGLAGVHIWTGPCVSVGCTGLEVVGARLAADAYVGNSSYLVEWKSGSWTATADVPGLPGDRWTALRGAGPTSWAMGTRGLLAVAAPTTWSPVPLSGGPPPTEVDFVDAWVADSRVWALAHRVYTAFGKPTVDAWIASWPLDGTASDPGLRWVKLGTALCASDQCGEGQLTPINVNGALLGGVGNFRGLYVVGSEFVGSTETAVFWFRPIPL